MPNEFPGRSATGSDGSPLICPAVHPEPSGTRTRPQWVDRTFAFLQFRWARVAGFAWSALAARTRKAEESERLAGAVTGLAGLAALAIALVFPAAYLLSANNRLMGIIEVRAQIYGDQVTDTASQHPELWNAFFGDANVDLTGLAIAAADDAQAAGYAPERRRVSPAMVVCCWTLRRRSRSHGRQCRGEPRCGRTVTTWAMSRLLVHCSRNS